MRNVVNKIASLQIDRADSIKEFIPQKTETVAPSVNSAPTSLFQERKLFDHGALLRQSLLKTVSSSISSNSTRMFFTQEVSPTAMTSNVQDSSEIDALAEQYCPIFYMHPDEKFFPDDPMQVIEGTNVYDPSIAPDDPRYAENINSLEDNALVDGQRVVAFGSPNEQGQLVYTNGQPVINEKEQVVDENGNPIFDKNGKPVIHITQLNDEQFMEFQGQLEGNSESAPVFYQYDPGDPNANPPRPPSMTYWLFSPNNHWDGPVGNADHQGDWERVTVVFGNGVGNEPTEVRYSNHSGSFTLPWSEAPRDSSGRPIVFVARGTHAMSPYPWQEQTSTADFSDYYGAGTRIDPLEGSNTSETPRLRDVEDEPWWGTRGHWGLKSDEGLDNEFGLDDGPQGPMPDPDGQGGLNGKGPLGEGGQTPFIYTDAGVLSLIEEIEDIANQSNRNPDGIDALGATIISTLARYNNEYPDDERSDFIAYGITVKLGAEKLEELSSTETGRSALRAMALELIDGEVSENEKEAYAQIYQALEPQIGDLPPPDEIQVTQD